MTKFNALISTFALLGLVACGVRNKTVTNNPPVIPDRVQKLGNEYGKLKPDSFSVFLWPEFKSEEEADLTIAKVSAASEAYEKITVQLVELKDRTEAWDSEFSDLECITFADLEEDEDPEMIDWIGKWKTPDPGDEVMAKTIERCRTNQDLRKEAALKLEKLATEHQAPRIDEIYRAVDPGYPDAVENRKAINIANSYISINRPERQVGKLVAAQILLKDFLYKGNSQSTETNESTVEAGRITEAFYNLETKIVSFKVPEMSRDETTNALTATGATYHFSLERSNLGSRAKFSGSIRLVFPNGSKRTGQASAFGKLN